MKYTLIIIFLASFSPIFSDTNKSNYYHNLSAMLFIHGQAHFDSLEKEDRVQYVEGMVFNSFVYFLSVKSGEIEESKKVTKSIALFKKYVSKKGEYNHIFSNPLKWDFAANKHLVVSEKFISLKITKDTYPPLVEEFKKFLNSK